MKLILCLDERNGMLFNKRRQSADRTLCDRMLDMCKGRLLWMNSYSAKLFDMHENIMVDEDFIHKAGPFDYAFAENTELALLPEDPEEIIVFRWDRHYPGDVRFPDTALQARKLVRTESFAGFSHEKITLEVYR